MKNHIIKLLGTGLLAFSVLLSGCNQEKQTQNTTDAASTPQAKTTLVFGTTIGDFGDMVKQSIKPILEKQGYTVRLIEFTDYVQPNLALAEGSIDVNIFQHKPYLDVFSKERNLPLSSAFQVPTAPLGLYPGKLTSLDQAKEGMQISAANDPSNFARALVMLNELGWIKLKDNVNPLTASDRDIAENPYKIKLIPLEAAQIPRARDDVDFAIINGNYAVSSGVPLTTALYQEPSFAYVNWGAMRTADLNEKWAKDIIAAYNSEEFKAYSHKKFVGYKYPANWNTVSTSENTKDGTAETQGK